MVKNKEFVMKNINNTQKIEVKNFIKNMVKDICKSCYLQTDCANNICVMCS